MKTKKITLFLLTANISTIILPISTENHNPKEELYSKINSHNIHPKIPITEKNDEQNSEAIENKGWSTKKKIAFTLIGTLTVGIVLCLLKLSDNNTKEKAFANIWSYYSEWKKNKKQ